MGRLRAIRDHGFNDLEGLDAPDVMVRYRFLEDEGDLGLSPGGVEAWSEPSLVVRFLIYCDGKEAPRLDVRFSRGEWPDVQNIPDDVLTLRLVAARAALNEHLAQLGRGPQHG